MLMLTMMLMLMLMLMLMCDDYVVADVAAGVDDVDDVNVDTDTDA